MGGLTLVGCAKPTAPPTAPTAQATDSTPAPDRAAATPAPAATNAASSAPSTATPDTTERTVRLVLADRSWSVTVRGPDAAGVDAALGGIANDVAKPARDAHLRIADDGSVEFTTSAP